MGEAKWSQKERLKKVLITGANRGIGLGFVKKYLQSNYFVVATTRNVEKQGALFQLAKENPNQLLIVKLEVTSTSSITTFKEELKQLEVIFDIIINNAGVSLEEPFGKWTPEVFENNIRVNTIGPALVAQAVVPFLGNNSKLVQVSSGMGSLELNINPEAALDAYAVSKAGLNLLTKRLASKFHTNGIIVVAINPGWVQTDMGGTEAPVTVENVVNNMVLTINKLVLASSGTFISDEGNLIPW